MSQPARDVPRVEVTSAEHFEQIRAQRSPVVITNLLGNWGTRNWSLQQFRERFGATEYGAEVKLPTDLSHKYASSDFHTRYRMDEFIDILQNRPELHPCYIHQKHLSQFPGLESDVRFDELLERVPGGRQVFLWIGSEGTKGAHHFDHTDNILGQAIGRKWISLVSPRDSANLYQVPGVVQISRVDTENPRYDEFPKFRRVTPYTVVLGPGEALFIPRFWWHLVRSLEHSVSVNCFFGERAGLLERMPSVASSGPVSWLTIVKDFFWHGVLGVELKTRLYATVPFGVWFYRQVAGYFERRLPRLRAPRAAD